MRLHIKSAKNFALNTVIKRPEIRPVSSTYKREILFAILFFFR